MSTTTAKMVADLKREIAAALRANRAAASQESRLHDLIADALTKIGVSFTREHHLGDRDRLDFFVENHLCIEVKKGAGGQEALRQMGRYLDHPEVTAAVGIAMRWDNMPTTFRGKPLHTIELWRLVL